MPVVGVVLALIERIGMDEVIERWAAEAAVEADQRLAQDPRQIDVILAECFARKVTRVAWVVSRFRKGSAARRDKSRGSAHFQ